MSDIRSFNSGVAAGIDLAIRLLEEGGDIDTLRKDAEFRQRTGISSYQASKEWERILNEMSNLITHTNCILYAAALRDAYDFGKEEIQEIAQYVDKAQAYLQNGWASFDDYINSLRDDEVEFYLSEQQKKDLGRFYRASPDDIYTEHDFIAPDAWEMALNRAGFTEHPGEDGCTDIVHSDGEMILSYKGPYQKIQCFDILQGILLERTVQEEARQLEEAKAREAQARANQKTKPLAQNHKNTKNQRNTRKKRRRKR